MNDRSSAVQKYFKFSFVMHLKDHFTSFLFDELEIGKRAVFVPPTISEPVADADSSVKGTLYCISIDNNGNLCQFCTCRIICDAWLE